MSSPISVRCMKSVRVLGYLLLVLALPLAIGQHQLRIKFAGINSAATGKVTDLPAPPDLDAMRPTVAVLLGDGGTEASDFLAPFSILAASGKYNVFAVAEQDRPHNLFPGGLDVMPHYTIAEFNQEAVSQPDVIVLPYMEILDEQSHKRLMDWVRVHWQADTVLVTICGGSMIAADAELLDGRTATSHQNILEIVRRSQPQVNWVDGMRYVADGNLISSAGISAGVDVSLYLIRQQFGDALARQVAEAGAYPHTPFLDNADFQPRTISWFWPGLNAAFSPNRVMGLALYQGASELTLAALIDTYTRSFGLQIQTLSTRGEPVISQHGLVLVPRHEIGQAPAVARVVIAGKPSDTQREVLQEWSAAQGLVPEALPGLSYPYDEALHDMARHHSVQLAQFAADGLEYPSDHLHLRGPRFPNGAWLNFLLLLLPGMLLLTLLRYGRGHG